MQQRVFNFMKWRHVAAALSGLLIVLSIGATVVRGINFGLDFTGGTLLELHYDRAPNLEEVRGALNEAGFSNPTVVNFGSDTEVMVRLKTEESDQEDATPLENIGERVVAVLEAASGSNIELMRADIIGSQVGEDLANDGGLGILTALALVFVYVAMRFQSKFSVAAVTGLIHDVIITVGVFAVFQLEFDLTVLAAVLAVIGYSINDTIVVADRVRENFRTMRDMAPFDLINLSLTQTLGRTILTSGTTMLVLFALYFVGGSLIQNFALALLVGIAVGTYSSIFICTGIMLALKLNREDLLPPAKEGAELEELP